MPKAKEPLVTIITPTFNLIKAERKDFMIQTIESVHNQTYKHIEHIVIDGGSTDGTLELLEEYAKKGWLKYYSEPDKGIYDAMNKGILKAKGKYVAFINSDDKYFDNNALEYLCETAEKEDAAWVYGHSLFYSEKGVYLWKGTIGSIPYGYYPNHQASLFLLKTLKEFGALDITNPIADNISMLSIFAKGYKTAAVDRLIAIFSGNGQSSSVNWEKKDEHTILPFYELVGKKLNLTYQECESLYCERCFYYKNLEDFIRLGRKLYYPEWVKTFFSAETKKILDFDRPIQNYEILNIPQVVRPEQKYKRLYLFGFIPLLKIKGKQ